MNEASGLGTWLNLLLLIHILLTMTYNLSHVKCVCWWIISFCLLLSFTGYGGKILGENNYERRRQPAEKHGGTIKKQEIHIRVHWKMLLLSLFCLKMITFLEIGHFGAFRKWPKCITGIDFSASNHQGWPKWWSR